MLICVTWLPAPICFSFPPLSFYTSFSLESVWYFCMGDAEQRRSEWVPVCCNSYMRTMIQAAFSLWIHLSYAGRRASLKWNFSMDGFCNSERNAIWQYFQTDRFSHQNLPKEKKPLLLKQQNTAFLCSFGFVLLKLIFFHVCPHSPSNSFLREAYTLQNFCYEIHFSI